MAGMSEKCCLCQRDLSDSTSRKKRKKLYGKSAEKSRDVLELLSEEQLQVSLAVVMETSSSNAYLCQTCDGQLGKFAHLRSEITAKLQCLHAVMQPSRKRPASIASSADDDEPSSSSTHALKTARIDGQEATTGHASLTDSRQSQESPTVQVSFVCVCLMAITCVIVTIL